ncbi:MAG: type II secretion system protein GspG [Acidobacteriota bacterium]|nr:type II secretion system protein GspG [Acidobacteriota bacterium]
MKTRTILLLPIVLATLFGLAVTMSAWRSATDNAMASCVASVHAGILKLSLPEMNLNNVGPEWRVLSEAESERLMVAAAKVHALDCLRGNRNAPLQDEWGNSFQMSVRSSASGRKPEFRIWSKGRDAVAGTPDDIVSPYFEKAPITR